MSQYRAVDSLEGPALRSGRHLTTERLSKMPAIVLKPMASPMGRLAWASAAHPGLS